MGISANEIRSCNCIGPQNGEPVCPCMMHHLKIVDGRYVQVIDYGPVVEQGKARHDYLQEILDFDNTKEHVKWDNQ